MLWESALWHRDFGGVLVILEAGGWVRLYGSTEIPVETTTRFFPTGFTPSLYFKLE